MSVVQTKSNHRGAAVLIGSIKTARFLTAVRNSLCYGIRHVPDSPCREGTNSPSDTGQERISGTSTAQRTSITIFCFPSRHIPRPQLLGNMG